ncbi:hypothetical protein SPBR_02250 [Sporothrix brasiliensis 5110]|uniref:Deacetylase sirtuin-type domain-containing protein n=1 Tax=Sporothrix brasiliensis 5110 TaxID=1398154 RepID=A0A0C2J104_9PEZI|nr:uncharacterized protein SPBR_02250 [Sporothrix brasiliensis 5110]KIH92660.1 hypothetical protein SPBR_02250 [Sporothrix brasiliensis 5110]
MPTSHVLPESTELLQDIADALWKAKKVLVVTGAGISTNSGIPAQFDAASKEFNEPGMETIEDDETEATNKRQRRSEDRQDSNVKVEQALAIKTPYASTTSRRRGRPRGRKSQNASQSEQNTTNRTPQEATHGEEGSIVVQLPALDPKKHSQSQMTPQRRGRAHPAAVGDSIECLGPLLQSSSPLSSPPSILFDPSEDFQSHLARSPGSSSSNSSVAASACSSDAESDFEDTASSSQPTLSSQSSFASNRSTLPVMKGRDLFDASIWADPVKTSVFYTFATTLRQKVREVVPTRSHEFISHLRNTNKLVRCYTQNIDEIEEKVGLSTSLGLGPGKKGRFSTRSARTSAGSTIASKDEDSQDSLTVGKEQGSQEPTSSQDSQGSEDSSASQSQTDTKVPKNGDPCFRGVECVFLHGSLRLLRCFRCGQTTPWDEAGRELETMSGRQPSCPRCAGATAAREGRGKRALAVGKLRPDIVLYGEEHPNAHLISPIVQHDISLTPDMLLILGTSLKVHGLKVLVREFAKAVHSRGGKVVFVNFTKPPESVWSDVIDYWVQWDCDAWVDDLKQKKPIMWLPPGSVVDEPKKKRKSISSGATKGKRNNEGTQTDVSAEATTTSDDQQTDGCRGSGTDGQKEKKRRGQPPKQNNEIDCNPEPKSASEISLTTELATQPITEKEATGKKRSRTGRPLNPDAKWPAATRDDQTNGAITVFKIVQTLGQISGRQADEMPAKPTSAVSRKRRPKQRHSAPGELEIVLSTCPPPTSTSAASEQITLSLPELLPSTTVEPAVAQTAALPNDRTELVMPLADISTNILPNLAITPRPLAGPDKYSILSAVKANPRRRQSKKIFEGGSSGPGGPLWTEVQTKQQQQQQRKQANARGRSKSMGVQASLDPPIAAATPSPNASPVDTAWSGTDRIAQQLMMDLSGSSFPAYSAREPPINCSSPAPLPLRETMQLPLPTGHRQSLPVDNSQAPTMRSSSNPTVLPPIRKIFPELQPRWPPENTFFFQDPLGSRYSYPPQRPQQEWSCTDQLVREADEQLKAVVIHRQQQ